MVFTWRSNMAGRYEVVLVHGHEPRQVTVQQGTVQRQQAVHEYHCARLCHGRGVAGAGAGAAGGGKTGVVSFWLRAYYLETFAETRYLDAQSTTQPGTPRNATCANARSASAGHVSDPRPQPSGDGARAVRLSGEW